MKRLLFLLAASLFATEDSSYINATLTNDPSTVIEGCVSAVTGAYFLSETDAYLPAYEPFSLKRFYLSSNQKGKEPEWEFFPHLRADRKPLVVGKDGEGDDIQEDYYYIKEPNGTLVCYKEGKALLGDGFCHYGSTTIANNRLEVGRRKITLYAADGSIRYYKRRHIKHNTLLVKERRPNGTHICYEYTDSVNPSRILVKSASEKITYLTLEFEYNRWNTGTQEIAVYQRLPTRRLLLARYGWNPFCTKNHTYPHLNTITTLQNPSDAVKYDREGKGHPLVLTERTRGERPPQTIAYHCRQDEPVRYGKVESITTPHNKTESATHRLEYFKRRTIVRDPLKNKTIYRFTDDKRLANVLQYRGSSLYSQSEYHWDASGDLTKKILYDGDTPYLTHSYTYDEFHNLLTETVSGDFGVQTTTCTYSNENNLYLLATKTDPSGIKESYTYLPGTNLPLTITTPNTQETFTYDDENILIKHHKTSPGYDLETRITPRKEAPAIHRPASIATYTCGKLLSRIEYTYNDQNLAVRETHYDASNKPVYTIDKAYDKKCRLISETDPLGRRTKTTYDRYNNPVQVTSDALAYTTKTTYDYQNRPIAISKDEQTETLRYDLLSRPILHTNHRGHKTQTEYDRNTLTTTVTQGPAKTTTVTDFLGRPIAITDADGYTTKKRYNALGQETQIIHPDGTAETNTYTETGHLKTYTDPNQTTTHYTHDLFGRILTKTIADTQTTYTYDAYNLLTETDPLGTTTNHEYDTAGRRIRSTTIHHRTEYAYDSQSRLSKTITYTSANEARVEIDIFDNASRVIERRSEDLSGHLYAGTTYTYDAFDNLLTERSGKRATTYAYDKWGRQTSMTDALSHTTTTTYTETPTLKITRRDPKGRSITTTHDKLGRPILSEAYLGQTLLARHRYTYTPAGDKTDAFITVITPKEPRTDHHSWSYTKRHQIASFTNNDLQTTRYTYTPTGQIATRQNPSGTTLTYSYDALGNNTRLTSSDNTIHYSYTYDKLSRLVKALDENTHQTTTRTYDIYSNCTSETLGNNLTIARTFDPIGRTTTLTYPDKTIATYTYNPYQLAAIQRNTSTHTYRYNRYGEETQSGESTFTYDVLGRKTSITSPHHTDAIHTYDPTSNPTTRTLNNQPHNYTYDNYDHLTSEPSHNYTYDSLHNRHTTDQTTHTINALNQDTSHTYDANGNPTSSPSHTYTYDALNRLTSIDDTRLTYDPLNRLIAINDDAILYDNDLDIGTYRNNTPLNLRILGNTPHAEIGAAVLVELDRTYRPYHDLFGNVILLDKPYTYTAYGATHDSPNPWQYQSKRTIGHLIYFGGRFYDPTLGRFLNPDPLGYVETYNLYHYALSSPLAYHDPWGLCIYKNWNEENKQTTSFLFQNSEENTSWTLPGRVNSSSATSSEESTPSDYLRLINNIPAWMAQQKLGRSREYSFGSCELSSGAIGYTNGINNSRLEFFEKAEKISRYANNARIDAIYNATNGLLMDILECHLGQRGFHTPPVERLKNKWQRWREKYGPDAKFLEICHSGGAIQVRNALLTSPESIRQQLIILAIAPGAIISRKWCYEAYNFTSGRDFVPFLDITGNILHGGELQILKPHPNASTWDHDFLSPTFTRVIQETISNYLDKHGNLK